jgi:hypothetical protein
MTEPEVLDWDLVNAFCDDELSPAETLTMEARLHGEPALRQMRDEVLAVTNALSALKPAQQEPGETAATAPPAEAPDTNRRLLAWCASVAAAVLIAGGVYLYTPTAPKSPAFWHQTFLDTDYTITDSARGIPVRSTSRAYAPDLEPANLFLVDLQQIAGKAYAAHYAGRNDCRLTILTRPPGAKVPDIAGMRYSSWQTDDRSYLIIAGGMDPRRFDVISDYVRDITRAGAQPSEVRTAKLSTEAAAPCQQV